MPDSPGPVLREPSGGGHQHGERFYCETQLEDQGPPYLPCCQRLLPIRIPGRLGYCSDTCNHFQRLWTDALEKRLAC